MSVGLMYGNPGGMGGAGQASTAQKAETGQASPGQAMNPADGANAITNSARMGIEVARQQAEIENIKSQTEKNKAETSQAGANTENIGTQTKLLLEKIPNEKLRGEAMQWENKQNEIRTRILQITEPSQIQQIQQDARAAFHQAENIIIQARRNKLGLETEQAIQDAVISDAYLSLDYKQSQIYKNLAEGAKAEVDAALAPLNTAINAGNLKINSENAKTRREELNEFIRNNNAKIKQGYINKGAEEVVKLYLGMGKNMVDFIDAVIPF